MNEIEDIAWRHLKNYVGTTGYVRKEFALQAAMAALTELCTSQQPQGVDLEDTLSKAMDMAKCGMGAVNVVDWLTQELIDSQSQQP